MSYMLPFDYDPSWTKKLQQEARRLANIVWYIVAQTARRHLVDDPAPADVVWGGVPKTGTGLQTRDSHLRPLTAPGCWRNNRPYKGHVLER